MNWTEAQSLLARGEPVAREGWDEEYVDGDPPVFYADLDDNEGTAFIPTAQDQAAEDWESAA